ncbi:ankyrin repeat-containing domain protein [Pavlovales sp. CCMP2436]|nr:ankyrin repeat-containing domain protein [Pavlovales sp. CCMP2436]
MEGEYDGWFLEGWVDAPTSGRLEARAESADPRAASSPHPSSPQRARHGEAGPSVKLPGRTSARLPPLLRDLAGDPLNAVLKLLDDADLPCDRLVCRTFRDHSSPAQKKCRGNFLRTHALVMFACESMPGFGKGACALAAHKGLLGVLHLLWSRCGWDRDVCHRAAGGGHLEVLRFVHKQRCPWNEFTCRFAAEGGHLEVLRYLHEHGCEWDSRTCRWAARGGHLEMLRYAHEHGCPWNSDTCSSAAERGHLEVLRYAHEHSCPWGFTTCYEAAGGGHLEVLRYAHEHGCWMDADACLAAAEENGHAEVVEYLHAARQSRKRLVLSTVAPGLIDLAWLILARARLLHTQTARVAAGARGAPWFQRTGRSANGPEDTPAHADGVYRDDNWRSHNADRGARLGRGGRGESGGRGGQSTRT